MKSIKVVELERHFIANSAGPSFICCGVINRLMDPNSTGRCNKCNKLRYVPPTYSPRKIYAS